MAVTLAAALLGSSSAAAAITRVVTFDDQAAGTTITDQYRAADGVRFDGQAAGDGFSPYVDQPGAMIAHSGDRVADINHCVGECGEGFFDPRTVGRLDTTASAVSMYVGYLANGGSSTAHLVLTAFDASGSPVGSQEADVTEGLPFTTKLEVVASAPIIAAFALEVPSGEHSEPVGFDDLTITYADAPPPPDFSLSPGLGVLDVLQGNSLDDPLTLNRINGSNGDVTFSVSGLPTGMTATFNPNPVSGAGTATTMTLHADDGAAFSSAYSTITITATPNSPGAGPAPRSVTALTRISQNCDRTVRFPYVDARSPGCFFKRGTEYATHNTDVRVNGLILKPLDGDRELDIDSAAKTIKSVRSTYAVAIDTDPDIPFYYGPIDWDFSGTQTGNHEVLGVDVSGVQALHGLPLTGMSAAFTSAGKAILRPTLNLTFWPFNYFGSLTATTQFTTDNDHAPDFSGLEIKLAKVDALGIELKDVEVKWQQGGTWSGQATLVLAFSHKYEVGAGFGLKDGRFDYLLGNVGGLNVAIGGGVFLQKIGFEVHRSPLTLQGTVGFSGGPSVAGKSAVTVDGGFKAVLDDPFIVEVDGSAKVADRFEVGKAFVRYSSTGLFEFGGSVNWDFKLIYVNGSVNGWVDGLSAFNVEGSVDGCVRIEYLPDPCAGARALVSSIGIAGCLTAYGYGVGAAASWSGDFDAFTGCDLSPWRATHTRAHAAAAPIDYTLPAGLPVAAWQVRGDGGPPGITLTGPDGETVTVNKDVPYVQNDRFVAGLGEDGTSFVFAKSPAAGTWRLTDDGTFPVKRVESARGLPQPRVTARVGGHGRARTISWTVKPIAGQRVRFAEIGRDVRNLVATAKGARGTARFRPADGPAGRRRIVALVEQNGRPRTTIDVASYRAPGTPRPHRVRHVRITRRGSRVTVRWRAHDARPFRHAVYLRVGDGRRLLRVLPAKRRSVTVRRIGRRQRVAVTVIGLTAANGKGPAARRLSRPGRSPRPVIVR